MAFPADPELPCLPGCSFWRSTTSLAHSRELNSWTCSSLTCPLGQDLTCFSNLLYDGPLRRVPRANKTFHELDQIEKLRCHDTQENEADKRLVESETYLAAIKLADLNPICEAINSPAMAPVPLPRARHALAYNLPPVAGSPRAASSR